MARQSRPVALSQLSFASDDNRILTLTDVSAGFSDTLLFSALSFSVRRGESVAVMGPSGSGKSTLLRCIAGLQSATGSILVGGVEIADANDDEKAWVRSRILSQLFQESHLLEELTVRENVEVPLRFMGVDRKVAARRSEGFLTDVGLAESVDMWTGHLSGGEAQRVALARTLAKEAPLILADEPTAALDRKAAATVGGMLIQVATRRNAALVVCTHDSAIAEQCDRFIDLAEF